MCESQISSSKLMTFISQSYLFTVECTLVSSLNKNKKKHSTLGTLQVISPDMPVLCFVLCRIINA